MKRIAIVLLAALPATAQDASRPPEALLLYRKLTAQAEVERDDEIRLRLRAEATMPPPPAIRYRIGIPYWSPPLVHSALSPRSMPSGEPAPTFRSKISP